MRRPNPALAYSEATCIGATPVGLVVLLYDRLAQDIHHAVAAMDAGDLEARSGRINHALLILQQLQGTLDFQRGEGPARQLDVFYSHVRGKLLEAQIRQSRELMLEQARAIADVRACWATLELPQSADNAEIPACLQTPAEPTITTAVLA
jgi:flagellar secretion chaperone FliS